MNCPRCQSEHWIKNGLVQGRQRYRCQECCYNFSVAFVGKDPQLRQQALQLYVEGLGFRAIGRLLQVSNVTVLKWVRAAGQQLENRLAESADQPRTIPVAAAAAVEIDERSAAAVTHLYWTKKMTTAVERVGLDGRCGNSRTRSPSNPRSGGWGT